MLKSDFLANLEDHARRAHRNKDWEGHEVMRLAAMIIRKQEARINDLEIQLHKANAAETEETP